MKDHSREIWALAIMLASAAVITATGVDGVLIDAAVQGEPGDWLGFVGSILGGAMTIVAGYVALGVVDREKNIRERELREKRRETVEALGLAIKICEVLFDVAQDRIHFVLNEHKTVMAEPYNECAEGVSKIISQVSSTHTRADLEGQFDHIDTVLRPALRSFIEARERALHQSSFIASNYVPGRIVTRKSLEELDALFLAARKQGALLAGHFDQLADR